MKRERLGRSAPAAKSPSKAAHKPPKAAGAPQPLTTAREILRKLEPYPDED